MSDMATIHLLRHHVWLGSGALFRVMLDGQEIGVIKDGKSIALSVPSGKHEIYVELRKKQRSPALILDLQAGEEIELICENESLRGHLNNIYADIKLWQESWRTGER